MNTLLTTSIQEGTGKTAVTVALGQLARERGASVGYMKPKGTRLESNVGKTFDADPQLARELLDVDASMADLEPVVYSPTFVRGAIRGRESGAEIRDRVREAFDGLAADRTFMAVEGGNRYTTGGVVDLTDADVAALLDAEALVVARYTGTGDVDELLAAAEAFGDRCAGVVFNAVADAQFDEVESDVAPFLESRGIPVHGVVPREQSLAGVTVSDLAADLGAEVLTAEADTDAYIERFHVAAMGAEAALRHLRRTKSAAVITGGDRADVQRAALEAPGVRCLVLTGGYRPSGAVVGAAEDAGVPVLLVQSETLATVERAEDVVDGGRIRDAHTVERMRQLLHDHADLDALLPGAE